MNYEEIVCDANNLYRAYKVSVKSSKWKESTQKFMMNFLRYIFEIQDDLINRTLQNGPTQEFELHERGRIRPITSIQILSLIHISEPTRRTPISYAVFCLKKKHIYTSPSPRDGLLARMPSSALKKKKRKKKKKKTN